MESKRFWISWLDFFAHFVSTTLRISNWTLQKRLGEWLCFSQGTNQCDHPKIFRRAGGTLHCSAFCLGGGGGKASFIHFAAGGNGKKHTPWWQVFFWTEKGVGYLQLSKSFRLLAPIFRLMAFSFSFMKKTCHAWEQCDARSSTHLFGTFECQTSAITNGFYVQVHK